ncbi:hypothetical protein [Phaeodactylibacter xiamenensis]|uniref:hypothetical protein n=1 Tax=Phaeodactylibacter xiamenensis TaxID=1524460 RepID=UPI003BAD906E
MILISLQDCKPAFPNCTGTDNAQAVFTFTDVDGHTGTVRVSGSIAAFNAISDTFYLAVDGSSGITTEVNPGGALTVEAAFGPGFNISHNKTVSMKVTDCAGYESVEEVVGYTDAVMTHNNEFIKVDDDHYLIFI